MFEHIQRVSKAIEFLAEKEQWEKKMEELAEAFQKAMEQKFDDPIEHLKNAELHAQRMTSFIQSMRRKLENFKHE